MARNKGRDVIGDYYKTNKEIEKENTKREKARGKGKEWSRTEIIMAIITGVALIGILVRYMILR